MKKPLAALLFSLLATLGHADDGNMEAAVGDIAHRWAKINYQTPAKEQEKAFKDLADQAGRLVASEPGKPQPLVWQAITLASYAKVNGGLGALSAVKQARDLLLAAEKIDPQTLHGSVYTSLGSLYAKVPGWPIGFGDKKQAKKYLETALKMNPKGIDAHYFYADYLAGTGDYSTAVEHLQQALLAPPRPGREDADAGRHKDVQALLDDIRSKHADKLAAR
jgi:tetratricopeptide (TPR) repeat protein